VRKRAGFLSPNRIPESVWEPRAKKQGHPAIYEDKRGFQDDPEVTPETGSPDIMLSSVQQFDIVRCLL
jgi:hypothetical protein